MTMNLTNTFTCLKCPIHTPKEAYYYFPSEDNEYVLNPSTKKPRRLIFEKVNPDDYLPYEKEKYNEYISDKDVQNNVPSKQNKEKMRTIFETKEENEACCSFNGCQCIII